MSWYDVYIHSLPSQTPSKINFYISSIFKKPNFEKTNDGNTTSPKGLSVEFDPGHSVKAKLLEDVLNGVFSCATYYVLLIP